MCGIAGAVNFKFDAAKLKHLMGHRGPDAQTAFYDNALELHHFRLSILDIAGGSQPMHYLNRYVIVFNGEIYNHQEVRKDLRLQCHTNSDTETLLQAFHVEGAAMLHRLDGMFAFAIYDDLTKRIFIARDRAGKKPLYYYHHQQQFIFASELNALRAQLPLEIDTANFELYFRLGAFFREQTPYKKVSELPNGHIMIVDAVNGSFSINQWWSILDVMNAPKEMREEEALEMTEGLIRQAVNRRLESSDLEVGCFLSGGIDSGLVTAFAVEHQSNIRTFTVSFDGQFNESGLAAQVAKKFGTRHTEIPIDFSHLKDDLERILANYGEPFFDSSAIPSYYVAREASQHITVVLNGDGADELFGGYRRFVPFGLHDHFNNAQWQRNTASALANIFPPGHQKKSLYNYFYRLVFLAAQASPELFLAAGPDIFEGYIDRFNHHTNTGFKHYENFVNKVLGGVKGGLNRMMALDFEISLFSDLLVKMDIASMANSIEARSPMLCKELLEFVPALSPNLKVRGKTTKYLLRKLAVKILPTGISSQPKRGFEIPLKAWVNGELNSMIGDYLFSKNTCYTQFIDQKQIELLWTKKWRVSDEKRAKMLWSLFCCEVWYHQCFLKKY
jgi:asparagine synthase (glutamine-hydrolysing)